MKKADQGKYIHEKLIELQKMLLDRGLTLGRVYLDRKWRRRLHEHIVSVAVTFPSYGAATRKTFIGSFWCETDFGEFFVAVPEPGKHNFFFETVESRDLDNAINEGLLKWTLRK